MALVIELFGKSATWDEEEISWVCSDKTIEEMLDLLIPEEVYSVTAAIREGGRPAMALQAVKKEFPEVKVLRHTPYIPPTLPEGAVL